MAQSTPGPTLPESPAVQERVPPITPAPPAVPPLQNTPSLTPPLKPGAKTYTLADIVNLAVNTNTSVVLARQQLALSSEGIALVNSQGRPQVRADAADTYTNYGASTATFGPTVTNPAVPNGGVIPNVVDQGITAATSTTGVSSFSSGTSSLNANSVSPLPGASTDTGGAGSSTLSLPGISGPSSGLGLNPTGSTTGSGQPATSAPAGTSNGGSSTASPSEGVNSTGTSGGSGATSGAATAAPSDFMLPMPSLVDGYTTESSSDTGSAAPAAPTHQAAARSAETAATARSTAKQPEQATDTTPSGQSANTGNLHRNNYGARLSLSQYIDAFDLLGTARDVAKGTRDFYVLDLDRVQNEVALSAKSLFFNVILAQQATATQQEQVNYATENVRITQARVQQGQAAGFDLLTAQTELANAQQALTASQNQLSLADANLNYLVGLPPGTPFNLTAPAIPPTSIQIDLNRSTQIAFQRRPELREADTDVVIAQRLVRLAGEGTTPTVGIIGSAEYDNSSTQNLPNNTVALGAELGIPLDDGGATRSRVRSARIEVASTQVNRNQLRQNVALEVQTSTINIQNAQTELATATQGITLATETLRVANVRYQNGVGTFLDVTNALAQLATARTNLANAQYAYQTSLAQLVRSLGSR